MSVSSSHRGVAMSVIALIVVIVYFIGVVHIPCTLSASVQSVTSRVEVDPIDNTTQQYSSYVRLINRSMQDATWLFSNEAASTTSSTLSACSTNIAQESGNNLAMQCQRRSTGDYVVGIAHLRTWCISQQEVTAPNGTTTVSLLAPNSATTSCTLFGAPRVVGVAAAAISFDGGATFVCVGSARWCDAWQPESHLLTDAVAAWLRPNAPDFRIAAAIGALNQVVWAGIVGQQGTNVHVLVTNIAAAKTLSLGASGECNQFTAGAIAGYQFAVIALAVALMGVSVAVLRVALLLTAAKQGTEEQPVKTGDTRPSVVTGKARSSESDGEHEDDEDDDDQPPEDRYLMQMDEGPEEDEVDVTKPISCVKGTSVYVVSIGFLQRNDKNADQIASAFLTEVATAATACEGHLSFRTAYSALVTFNTVTPLIDHEKQAIAFTDAISGKESCKLAVIAVTSGALAYNPNTKPPLICGPCIDDVLNLHELQIHLEVPILVSELVTVGAPASCQTRAVPVDYVSIEGRAPMAVFELLPSPYAGDVVMLRNVLSMMNKGSFDTALTMLNSMQRDEFVTRLSRRCATLRHVGPGAGGYCRQYIGWDGAANNTAAAAAAAAGNDDDGRGMETTASSRGAAGLSGSTLSLIDSITLDYVGLPYDWMDLKGKKWLRSDKVIGSHLGITLYAGMSEEGAPVAIWGCDLDSTKFASREALEGAFRRHVGIASQLDHPGIIKVHSAAKINTRWFCLVEESLPGGDLQWLLREFAPLHMDTIRRLGRELLDALRYLHHKRIVHGSLSWHSIRLAMDGMLHVCWFANAVDLSRDSTAHPASVPHAATSPQGPFLPPEVTSNRPIHPCSDMFSFGAILLTMICGQAPLSFTSVHVEEAVLKAGIAEAYRFQAVDLITACLRDDPHTRLTPNEAALHRFFS